MSAELATMMMALLAVGVALAGLILNVARELREEVRDVREEVRDVRNDVRDLRNDFGELRERMARLEGLIEGFTGRSRQRRGNLNGALCPNPRPDPCG